MARSAIPVTGRERTFPNDEIIVSKTDAKGRLTYVNDVFLGVSGYSEGELLGQPHSIVRHPRMPRAVFRLLWERIEAGHEIFAYINNRAKNGDHYWVFAHVTPNLGAAGEIVGFHSNRRSPRPDAIRLLEPLYAKLVEAEERHESRKVGLDESYRMLTDFCAARGKSYDEFIHQI